MIKTSIPAVPVTKKNHELDRAWQESKMAKGKAPPTPCLKKKCLKFERGIKYAKSTNPQQANNRYFHTIKVSFFQLQCIHHKNLISDTLPLSQKFELIYLGFAKISLQANLKNRASCIRHLLFAYLTFSFLVSALFQVCRIHVSIKTWSKNISQGLAGLHFS